MSAAHTPKFIARWRRQAGCKKATRSTIHIWKHRCAAAATSRPKQKQKPVKYLRSTHERSILFFSTDPNARPHFVRFGTTSDFPVTSIGHHGGAHVISADAGNDANGRHGFDEAHGRHVPGDDATREGGDALHHRHLRPLRRFAVRCLGSADCARNPVDQVLAAFAKDAESRRIELSTSQPAVVAAKRK